MKRALSAILLGTLIVSGVLVQGSVAEAKAKPTIHTMSSKSLFKGGLYVQSDSDAARALAGLTDPAQIKAAKYVASRSVAIWLGDWYDGDVLKSYIARNLAAAEKAKQTPVFVTYALPDRDCGGHSAGGFDAANYLRWNKLVVGALKGHRAAVLVEPDSLSIVDSCPVGTADTRYPLLTKAVKAFSKAKIPAYLDGGLSNAVDYRIMAIRLKASGISYARGFFTNVANYRTVSQETVYAKSLSKLVGNAHFVIDVGRSGTGYHGEWCNAPGAGLGVNPRVASGKTKLDALLWVKTPGSSDGTCNGGPNAGTWYPSYAVDLYRNRQK